MPPKDVMGEFANTYEEWHYLVGGVCMGYVAGWVSHSVYALAKKKIA